MAITYVITSRNSGRTMRRRNSVSTQPTAIARRLIDRRVPFQGRGGFFVCRLDVPANRHSPPKHKPVPAPKKQPGRTVLRACWRCHWALPPVREVGCISNAPRWTPNCVREGTFFSKFVFGKVQGESTSFKWFLTGCLVFWIIDLGR